jgi:acetyl-CoA carboxylase biotin carboxyl carrier protein
MIDLAFVESLIKALDESSLDSLEVERGGTRVRLSKSPMVTLDAGATPGAIPQSPALNAAEMPVPAPAGASSPDGVAAAPPGAEEESAHAGLIEVTSPMVGTFYAAPAPDADPYVEVGHRIGKGTVLCIIEAMKLMNELESEVEGTIAKIMVENAQPVEYGQVLFLIDPS